MQFEQRRWESEVAKAESSFGEALAKQDRAEIVIQSARVAGAKAQLDLVENDLQRATLRAPFAGVVLEGDLTRSLGAPIRRGENLMTIAPAEGFRLMLKVDERDIASVQLGQRGRMVLAAQPGEALDIEVARITPLATAKEGRNTFEVEARVLSEAPSLRPGLEGVAKLPAERRSLYWLVSHRTIQWLQLSLWEWLG
jgi:multidrug resistance efflux pump